MLKMSLHEAVDARHSVRRYMHKPLDEGMVSILQTAIDECNREGNLHIQLITGDTRAFSGIMTYGKFSGVENYFVMAGYKTDDLDERIGYYGEKLVLLAQQLGLNTCWAGLSFNMLHKAYTLRKGEKLVCLIALGYGETQGICHPSKEVQEVSNAGDLTPSWFLSAVRCALKAPTAINQQKFFLEFLWPDGDHKTKVRFKKGFSLLGYTSMDMGIAKLHFEIGAGDNKFEWVDNSYAY